MRPYQQIMIGIVVLMMLMALPFVIKGCVNSMESTYPTATWKIWAPLGGIGGGQCWDWHYSNEKPEVNGHCVEWFDLRKGRTRMLCNDDIIMERIR